MSLRAASLGLAAAATLGGAAKAADFDDFHKLCVAPHGDGKAALAAADAAGWSPLPDAMLSQLKRPGMETARGRMKSDASGMRFMMIASNAKIGGDQAPQMDACALVFAPGSPGVADQVKAWAGVPEASALSKDGLHGYIFLDEGGRHRAVEMPGPTAPMNPQTAFVMVQEQPQVTIVAYGVASTTSAH